ncbi:MAG: hypothetical protein KGP28_08510, partial [Bdellovibrionales bacterium]|nr:hypothetical protein [Bdellovibrionales bacterium]
NMIGPQVFPEFSFRITPRRSVMTYLKYAPVLAAGSFDFLRNREIAAGLYYRQLLSGTNNLFAGLDYSLLDATAGGDKASARSLSLGIGFGF